MKPNAPRREAGLIQGPGKLATTHAGVTDMTRNPILADARQWLTPDHQAVLAVIARWLGEAEATETVAVKTQAEEGQA